MLTCPHCEHSLSESNSLESLHEDRTWDGICGECGRSIYESHDHAAAPDPEAFDSRAVGDRALSLLETATDQVEKTLLPEAWENGEHRDKLAEIWGRAHTSVDASLTIKWAREDSERPAKMPEDEFSSPGDEPESHRPADFSQMQTLLPDQDETAAQGDDPSSQMTFAEEISAEDRETKPAEETAGGSRSLSIRARSLSLDPARPQGNSDYELLEMLGQGGMGVVYKARQASIDRHVAIKMVKTETVSEHNRKSFISEAVVTGELDHPNIVPIYDLGKDESGALFYSMKEVKGTPWKDVIQEKSLAENLEILLRVADAVAFGHSRGVVHCDLKPENVMLGEYGEVLVMDWGLAQLLPAFGKPREIAKSADGGGTPAYMAPEMAIGKAGQVTIASDVYLLGAILFQIVTGKPPHAGRNAIDCLVNVAKNVIQPTEKSGELLDIAYKAMATKPADRQSSVLVFQKAIREYQSHSESIHLSDRAAEILDRAHREQNYELFAQALASLREALSLWSENSEAAEGLRAARYAYAECALNKGDLDLGLSLLDETDPDHLDLYGKIVAAQRDREVRQQRLRRTKRLVAALGGLIVLGATLAALVINEARKDAHSQREIAEEQAEVAKEQRGIAQKQSERALFEQRVAEVERKKAEAALEDAVVQKAKAEEARELEAKSKRAAQEAESEANAARQAEAYEAYVARIQLAAAKIEENAFDSARRLLEECKPGEGEQDLRGWEWKRLMHLCHQSEHSWKLDAPAESVAFSPDGGKFVLAAWDGHARVIDLKTNRELFSLKHEGQYVHGAAFSPDGKFIATGSNDPLGFVRLWDANTGAPLKSFYGHTDAVLSVRFTKDASKLLTTSYDHTARLWNVATGKELKRFEGHFWWVWSAAFSPDEKLIVTASHDGTGNVYDVKSSKKIAEFTGHRGPVFAAEFSPDGETIATGGFDRRVLIWKSEDQPKTDLALLAEGKRTRAPVFSALDGHTSGVRTLQFTSDGRRLLTGSDDNTLKLWNLETKRPIETLRGHDGWIASCALSPDGKWAVSASQDQQVRLWNLGSYEETRALGGHVLGGHGDAVLSAAFSADGTLVATSSRDRTARLWSAEDGRELKTFAEGHSFLSMQARFSPDGLRLFTAAFDNTVRVWDVVHGTEVARIDHTGRNAALAVSPDGKFLVTGSDDDTAKVWSVETVLASGNARQNPEPLWVLDDHRREVTTVAFSRSGKWIYTGDAKGRGRLWEAKTGRLRHRLEGHAEAVTAAVFLPEDSKLLTASRDKTVGAWDVETGDELRGEILNHPDDVTSLALLADGNRLITSCDDKTVRLWNLTDRQVERTLHQGDDIHTVDVSPDGKLALGLSSVEGLIRVWRLEDGREWTTPRQGKPAGPFFELASETDSLWSAVFSPDNHGLLTVAGNDVRLWNLNTREERMSFNPHGAVASAEFSPDGKFLVTAGWDRTARIWNIQTGRAEQKLIGVHDDDINQAVFSPGGLQVLTASDDGTAAIWDLASGRAEHVLRGHEKRVNSAVFSADGRWILTASDDRTARIWDAQTGEERLVLTGHQWAVQSAEFSRDGKFVLTASDDNTARLWQLIPNEQADGSVTFEAEEKWVLKGHSAAVVSGGFSPDGMRLVTGSRDDTAIIWDAGTGQELLTLRGHTQDITSARFSDDGEHVITSSRDGTAVLWLTTMAERR